jgi:hypothetical protein
MSDEKKEATAPSCPLITVEQSLDPAVRLSQEIVDCAVSVLNDRDMSYNGHLVAVLGDRGAAREYASKLNAQLPDGLSSWEAILGSRPGEVRIARRGRRR